MVKQNNDMVYPISARTLTIEEAKKLPLDILCIEKNYWLEPNEKGCVAPFVNIKGEIKKSSVGHCYEFRIVLVFENGTFSNEKYENYSFAGEEYYVLDSNKLLMKESVALYSNCRNNNSYINHEISQWFDNNFNTFKSDDLDPLKDECLIPEGTLIIDDEAAICSDISEVVIPGSVYRIGNRAFQKCLNLRKVIFKKKSEHMNNGSGIFYICPNLKEVHFEDFATFANYSYDCFGPLENGSRLFIGGEQVRHLIIPSEFEDLSFMRNLKGAIEIEDVTFPDGTVKEFSEITF